MTPQAVTNILIFTGVTMAEENTAGEKRNSRGRRSKTRGLANGSGKNGHKAGRPAPKLHAKGRGASRRATKKRRASGVGGVTDTAADIVRGRPVLSMLAAFAAGIIIGFRPGRR